MPWHCLRHSFCTGLADAGVQINIIKELAGHSSITTTLRYMHTNSEARSDAIRMAFGRQMGDRPSEKEKTLAKLLT
jgi:site-specific recombinase XerD